MQLFPNLFVVVALIGAVSAASSKGIAQTVTALGDLPGGRFHSEAFDVSADGSVIVGYSDSDKGREAFRWTRDGGMQGLGDLPGGDFHSEAGRVSADVSVIVGFGTGEKGREAFRWTRDGGMVGLGVLMKQKSTPIHSVSTGVSEDGSVVFGVSYSMAGFEVFRWTKETGMQGMGNLKTKGLPRSIVMNLSESGLVAVGVSDTIDTEASISHSDEEAFRWTKKTGMQRLGDLPGGRFHSEARGVSADGSVIVGLGTGEKGRQSYYGTTEAFRWTKEGGMQGLGDLPGRSFYSEASGVSADGSVIVGFGTGEKGREAFRWTKVGGIQGLGDLPGGGFRSRANAVSADGSVIVEDGQSDKGTEAFRWTK